jgi:hypothetical protein
MLETMKMARFVLRGLLLVTLDVGWSTRSGRLTRSF